MKTTDIDPHILELFEFRQRKGDLKKIEIIKATIEVLSEAGLENTTYDSIATKIGTRRAHVAYHFDDKKKIFLAAVKYILADFQQSILVAMEKAKENRESDQNKASQLHAYVDGVFEWAKASPQQVQVMLMLYYLCTIDREYLDLHDSVRKGGFQRLSYLFQQLPGLGAKSAQERAKLLQNYLSGTLMDLFTTKETKLLEAQKKSHKFIDLLIREDFF